MTTIVQEIFSGHIEALDRQIESCIGNTDEKVIEALTQKAASDLESWKKPSGKAQFYTPLQLVCARISKECANAYEHQHQGELLHIDALHQARIAHEILNSGLAEKMMSEGANGRKLGILELSARLMPTLTFPGSSAYFEVGILPYGTGSRLVLGETREKDFVCLQAAIDSATNLSQKFGLFYVLAETSSAPRTDVTKSGKKPELYIASKVGEKSSTESYLVNANFRSHFNAQVRELMYRELRRMYEV